MIRVVLPPHLRGLARISGEVKLEINGQPTLRAVLDALEASYPMLSGTIRDHATQQRRPLLVKKISRMNPRTLRCPTRLWPGKSRY